MATESFGRKSKGYLQLTYLRNSEKALIFSYFNLKGICSADALFIVFLNP